MRTSLVLTILGDDKPGIVEQLSDQIRQDVSGVDSVGGRSTNGS